MAWLFCYGLMAQNVTLTLAQADSLFRQRNLEVIAARCNISMADADAAQARLWANPVVSIQENVYNKFSHRYFDFGKTSEQVVNVDQLIYICGQHSRAVAAARLAGEQARREFAELLRGMHGRLAETFIRLYFAQHNLHVYTNEIGSLRTLLAALQQQERKGNISQIETARIQALLLALRQEQEEQLRNENELEGQLKLFIAMPADSHIKAVVNVAGLDNLASSSANKALIDSCAAQRSDVLLAQTGVSLADARIKVEQAKAAPEVHINGQYDRNGGYFPQYFAVGVTLSVPVFNRNQGAIRRAKAAAEQSRSLYAATVEKAQTEVQVARTNLDRALSLCADVNRDFDRADMDTLFNGVNDNYRKRNISLLEFVDFYKTYKDAMLQASGVKESAFLAIARLNTAAGQDIIAY